MTVSKSFKNEYGREVFLSVSKSSDGSMVIDYDDNLYDGDKHFYLSPIELEKLKDLLNEYFSTPICKCD